MCVAIVLNVRHQAMVSPCQQNGQQLRCSGKRAVTQVKPLDLHVLVQSTPTSTATTTQSDMLSTPRRHDSTGGRVDLDEAPGDHNHVVGEVSDDIPETHGHLVENYSRIIGLKHHIVHHQVDSRLSVVLKLSSLRVTPVIVVSSTGSQH